RGYWAPINEKGRILHVGVSHAGYDTDADTLRLRVRPGADMANRLVDTGNMTDADRIATTGLEGLWVNGPVKLQAEYMRSEVERYRPGASNVTGSSGYVSALWNAPGESWGYKNGVPTTGLPASPGTGMWQGGLRYDTIDLDDSGVPGGTMDALTAGVNLY